MTRSRTHLARAVMVALIAIAGLISAAGAVFAYPGVPAAGAVVSTTCSVSLSPGASCSITVKFTSSEGSPIANASVSWTVSVPPGGTVTPNPSTTAADGTTTVTYHAPVGLSARAPGEAVLASDEVGELAVSVPCGSGTVTGKTGSATATVAINVPCLPGVGAGAGTNGSGTTGSTSPVGGLLPAAGTTAPSAPLVPRWVLVALAGAALVLSAGGMLRLRRSRRLGS